MRITDLVLTPMWIYLMSYDEEETGNKTHV